MYTRGGFESIRGSLEGEETVFSSLVPHQLTARIKGMTGSCCKETSEAQILESEYSRTSKSKALNPPEFSLSVITF